MYAVYEFNEYVGTCQSLASFKSYCGWKDPNRQWDIIAINPKNGCMRYYDYRAGCRWHKYRVGKATEELIKQANMDISQDPKSSGRLPKQWYLRKDLRDA